jgi:hypothetical protein
MKIIAKTALLIAGTATLIAAAPANARYDRWGHRDGIDAGDVIAGALIIGGIAAIASAGNNRNSGYGYGGNYGYRDGHRYGYRDDYRGDRRYDNNGYYENGYDSRQAVNQCVRAAQREASRYGWARVTDVGDIYRIRGGYEVRGRLVVETRGRGYDRGYYYDRYNNDYDKGRFTCTTRYGGIDDLRVSGLHGGW